MVLKKIWEQYRKLTIKGSRYWGFCENTLDCSLVLWSGLDHLLFSVSISMYLHVNVALTEDSSPRIFDRG